MIKRIFAKFRTRLSIKYILLLLYYIFHWITIFFYDKIIDLLCSTKKAHLFFQVKM